MDVVSSYPVRLSLLTKQQRRLLSDTDAQYNEAVCHLLSIVEAEWDVISLAEKKNERQMVFETLVHATTKRPHPKYADFDEKFPNFPSYYRRAAITAAIGAVSSYKSYLTNWEKGRGAQARNPSSGTSILQRQHVQV